MELVNRNSVRVGEYQPIGDNSRSTKRIFPGVVAATLLIILVVTFAVIWKSSGTSEADGRTDRPTLEWEGDCPVEAPECPLSFRGLPAPLLLISMDGFRSDYLSDRVPTLQKLSRCGVRAQFLGSVYPTKTYVNHYSLVTGLYPSSHGIIDNKMYDPDLEREFKRGHQGYFDPEWWQREPIWVSAEKQGKRTATFFFPGSDVRINGTRPTYYRNFSAEIPLESRVVQVLEWLDLPPPLRPALITLYSHQPDHATHVYGTTSEELPSALEEVDRMVEALFAGLQLRNLTGCVNVIIASDHGVADTNVTRVVDLRDYLNDSDVWSAVGTFGRLRPLHNKTTVSDILSSLRCRDPHLRVFLKEELPVRMHYSENPRIDPVILDMDSGWTVLNFDCVHGDHKCTGAVHGYDNFFPEMRAFFMAIGPSMKRNATVDPFLNLEIYELMCELIEIAPNPNNGTRGSLHHLMRSPSRPLPPRALNGTTPPPTAEVAKDAKEYAKRVQEAQCPCAQSHPQVDVPVDDSYHLPFGAPSSSSSATVLVRNRDYLVGYDEEKRTAKWAAFTVNATELQNPGVWDAVCWRGDARVAGAKCQQPADGFVQWPLYPPMFTGSRGGEAASYVTNSVTVSVEYASVIRGEVWRRLENETQLHVITGPAYARGPTSLPSHLFVVAVFCSEEGKSIADCPASRLRVDAYLLPNYPYPDNCESAWRSIQRNVARVLDIEGATGLEFFTGLPHYEAIRLRTALPSSVTKG